MDAGIADRYNQILETLSDRTNFNEFAAKIAKFPPEVQGELKRMFVANKKTANAYDKGSMVGARDNRNKGVAARAKTAINKDKPITPEAIAGEPSNKQLQDSANTFEGILGQSKVKNRTFNKPATPQAPTPDVKKPAKKGLAAKALATPETPTPVAKISAPAIKSPEEQEVDAFMKGSPSYGSMTKYGDTGIVPEIEKKASIKGTGLDRAYLEKRLEQLQKARAAKIEQLKMRYPQYADRIKEAYESLPENMRPVEKPEVIKAGIPKLIEQKFETKASLPQDSLSNQESEYSNAVKNKIKGSK